MSESTLSNRTFGALLFDMDGTILNSIAAAERVWAAWAERHGLDVASFLPAIQGVRAIETITKLELPGIDPPSRGSRAPACRDRGCGGHRGDRGRRGLSRFASTRSMGHRDVVAAPARDSSP
jgi:hypothetical protein